MRLHICILLSILRVSLKTVAQNKQNFIGINPSVTVEPFYNKGEFDVNILPFVYQRTMTNMADLRFTSVLNLGIRYNGNNISHFGLETAFPVFSKRKKIKQNFQKAFL